MQVEPTCQHEYSAKKVIIIIFIIIGLGWDGDACGVCGNSFARDIHLKRHIDDCYVVSERISFNQISNVA